ncbi:Replication initiator protein [Xanthomonas citri pv. fuscans]|nr:Replication initiator protein [Xanthomonas citri pv. fuscans]
MRIGVTRNMDLVDLAEAKSPTRTDLLVVQSNQLIESSHTLTLNEKRLVIMAAAYLDSRKPMPEKNTVKIHACDFANVYDLHGGQAYQAIEKAARQLYNRSITRIESRGKRGPTERNVRWVWMCEYMKNEAAVVLGFTPVVAPYLTMLNEQFTKYTLGSIRGLSTFYAIRVYELCSQFRKTGERRITLDQLRDVLDLGAKYQDVKNLRMRVLDPSVEEITKLSDLTVTYEPMRKGRKIVGFEFDISEREVTGEVLDVLEAGSGS